MIEFRQKEFANFLGAKHQIKRLERQINRKLNGRHKNGRLQYRQSQGTEEDLLKAAERLRQRKLAKINKRAETTFKQDLENLRGKAGRSVKTAINKTKEGYAAAKKEAQYIASLDRKGLSEYTKTNAKKGAEKVLGGVKTGAKVVGKGFREAYENTGKHLGTAAKVIYKNPEIAVGNVGMGLVSKGACYAVLDPITATKAATTLPFGKAWMAAIGAGKRIFLDPNKVVKFTRRVPTIDLETGERSMKEVTTYVTQRRRAQLRANNLGRAVSGTFRNPESIKDPTKGAWSIKKGVDFVKRHVKRTGNGESGLSQPALIPAHS